MMLFNRRAALGLLAGVLLISAGPVLADEPAFLTAKDVSLLDLLPAPPAPDSETTKAEIAAYHAFEATRTEAQAQHAIADDEETVFRFLAGMGVILDPAKVPLTAKFFEGIAATEGEVVDPAKKVWARPRPPVVDATIKPLIELSKSGSYPSGHATLGMLFAITLSKMLPEKKDELFARAFDYGYSRYVVGVHYLSDIEASKMAGAAIGNTLLHDDAVVKAMEPVKGELRTAMGMM
ncbi:phosphatase PAP2 family protein [Nordella sp. HKS 07]|uniref:acid phosphatase n=1 Tax=Nordella sp. HKS 07 TaxID=2712222 RepID=UPI0013E17936|nr:phosphatase PAP2 family protein [Nordella sp. HKS 07]QIG52247.1 phosphatase PAP2 family protein [Nordella sp. HKS 07]